MKRFLLLISVLGSSLIWAEDVVPSASEGKGDVPVVRPEDKETDSSSDDRPEQGRKEPKQKKDRPGEGRRGPRGFRWKDMNDSQRERLLYFHYLIMGKYDANRSGVLEPDEMEGMKRDARRFREERRQLILKQYDKNGDGKLDEEERQAMRDDLKAKLEKRLKERRDGKGNDADDMPPPPPPPGHHGHGREGKGPGRMEKEKPEKGKSAEAVEPPSGSPKKGSDEGRGNHSGERRGPVDGRSWGPESLIMSQGYHLMMEKFDKDKDGKLSAEEKKDYQEDRKKFSQRLNAIRKKLKNEGKLEEVEKNPPPVVAPSPEAEKKGKKAEGVTLRK